MMTDSHLDSRRQALQSQIAQLQSSGEVAPPKTWIESFSVVKPSGKRYVYYRLMEATERRSSSGKIQGKVKRYLGSASSPLYKRWAAAIERRRQLKLLQKQCESCFCVADSLGTATEATKEIVPVRVSGGYSRQIPPLTLSAIQQQLEHLTALIHQLATALEVERQGREGIVKQFEHLRVRLGVS